MKPVLFSTLIFLCATSFATTVVENCEDDVYRPYLTTIEGREGVEYDRTDRTVAAGSPYLADTADYAEIVTLDLGGGSYGRKARELSLNSRGRVISIDLNAEREFPWDRHEMVRGDAAQMPFAAESFDLIISEYSVFLDIYAEKHSREFLVNVLTECERVLKPGGKIRLHTPSERVLLLLSLMPEFKKTASNGTYFVEYTKAATVTASAKSLQ